jgi:hypothetical protein
MKSLLIFTFFLLSLTQSLFAADCTHRVAYIEPECNRSCIEPETCQPADANNEEFCCINMEQPEGKPFPTRIIVALAAVAALGLRFQIWRRKKLAKEFSDRQK